MKRSGLGDVRIAKKISDIGDLFNNIADRQDFWKHKNRYYYRQIEHFYSSIVPEGSNILEIGSGDGRLLNVLKPVYGAGLDISFGMVELAKRNYPHLTFVKSTIEGYDIKNNFNYIIISNLLEYIPDLYDFFNALHGKISSDAKVLITGVNPLWGPVMKLATKLKMRTPIQMRNFVTSKDIENILNISGYEVIESGYRIFLPKNILFISYFLNKLIPRLPIFRNLCLVQYIIAKPRENLAIDNNISASVIIPCYNEEDNITECINRVPNVGNITEILVVDDGSTDSTADIVKNIQKQNQRVRLISYTPNKGKGHAVMTGFDAASGEILMILDADMAVMPEDLIKFYNVLASRQAEFINGTRTVYDMAPGAMKFVNYLGNKIFGIILSFIIGQRNTDTLCGTKAFYKKDYKNFKMGKCPWGDFDLLFEAARMKLKTVEMPVHYYPRLEGVSKMKVFKHGVQLLKMCWYGFWYLG